MATKKKAPARKRKSTKKQTNKFSLDRFFLKWGSIFLVLIILFTGLFFAMVRLGFFGPIPTYGELKRIKNPIASEVFSEDGKLIGRYYHQNRSHTTFDELPEYLIQALVATEDARFYEHRGVDEWAIARVFVKTIILGHRGEGGGSTLSQQVVKNLYGRSNHGLLSMPVAKFRESIIAFRLEKIYTKDEIITLYLSTVPFAENTYGVKTAAERFFSKKLNQLTVPEAAVLVGMLKANSTYNPRTNPEKSKKRRNTVISRMVSEGYLSEKQGEKYKKTPLILKYNYLVYNTGKAAYFREKIKPELLEWCKYNEKEDGSAYDLFNDGLRIITTLDSRMQTYAEEAVKQHMSSLQKIFEEHWKGRNPFSKGNVLATAIEQSDRYRKLKAQGRSKAEIDAIFNTPIKTKLFSWNGEITKNISPRDSVKHMLMTLRTGMLAMNPHNGEIKAWVGGNDFRFFQYDHVTAKRQVGSVFKPIMVAAALKKGLEPDAYISNAQEIYEDYDDWSPSNADGFYDGYYSVEGGLAHSVNTVAVKIMMEYGIGNTIDMAHEMGIKSDLPKVPSLALGVADISLLEMLTAYSTFPNHGYRIQPHSILRIEDADGNVLADFEKETPEKKEVLSEEQTRIMNHYLQAVVDSGTSRSIRFRYHITGDFAGKTGTTQNHADGWFIGYSPGLVVGCWTGGQTPAIHFRTLTHGQGAKMALPVVGMFYKKVQNTPALSTYTQRSFIEPGPKLRKQLDQPLHRDKLDKKLDGQSFIEFFKIDSFINPIEIFKTDPNKKDARRQKRARRKKEREKKRAEKSEQEKQGLF